MLAVMAAHLPAGDFPKAEILAAKAAAYCHPKVAHTQTTGVNKSAQVNVQAQLSLELLTEDQRIALRAVLEAGIGR